MMKPVVTAALTVFGIFAFAAPVLAQPYPNRTVTIIVPYSAGGPTDETARVVARSLTEKLKQNFIVQNVTGGGTNIATNQVAHAAPDGYTLLLHNLAIAANVTLYKALPFDTEKDLTPVLFINRNPLVLVGRKNLEPNTLTELIAWMKTHRAKAAIAGYGTTGHLATNIFLQETKLTADQIPYRGGAPLVTDLLGGHVDLVLRHAAAVGAAGRGREVEGLWHHHKRKVAAAPCRRKLCAAVWTEVRNSILAGAVRAQRHAGLDHQ